jgi:hypothetical protein
MERELVKFGGGVSHTVVHPIILILVLIAGLLICVLPRRTVIVPFLLASILIPTDQILVVGPLHFPMLRILILFGLVRIIKTKLSSNSPLFHNAMNRIDKLVILLTIITAIDWILLWRQSATVIYQLGEMYTVLGVYFLLRFLIRDRADIVLSIRMFALVTTAVAAVMTYEHFKGWNPYALFGGAQSSFFSAVMERDGRYRSTGCFGHPILAGSFGASLLPMFVALWWIEKRRRTIVIVGVLAASVMVITSNSSTPVLAYLAGILGLCFWPLRHGMRALRWGIIIVLVSLHMVMKAPVWNLIARIDISGGSSGDHRYQLINQFILHFKDWWLLGVKNNGQWGWDMWDTANQYVNLGQNSGIVPFILFLAVIVYGFKFVGAARKSASSRPQALFLWALGCALFAHVVAFFGISYFDQTIVAWYALLACISVSVGPLQKQARTVSNYRLTAEPELQPV